MPRGAPPLRVTVWRDRWPCLSTQGCGRNDFADVLFPGGAPCASGCHFVPMFFLFWLRIRFRGCISTLVTQQQDSSSHLPVPGIHVSPRRGCRLGRAASREKPEHVLPGTAASRTEQKRRRGEQMGVRVRLLPPARAGRPRPAGFDASAVM